MLGAKGTTVLDDPPIHFFPPGGRTNSFTGLILQSSTFPAGVFRLVRQARFVRPTHAVQRGAVVFVVGHLRHTPVQHGRVFHVRAQVPVVSINPAVFMERPMLFGQVAPRFFSCHRHRCSDSFVARGLLRCIATLIGGVVGPQFVLVRNHTSGPHAIAGVGRQEIGPFLRSRNASVAGFEQFAIGHLFFAHLWKDKGLAFRQRRGQGGSVNLDAHVHRLRRCLFVFHFLALVVVLPVNVPIVGPIAPTGSGMAPLFLSFHDCFLAVFRVPFFRYVVR
jgi:hypothetical protein